MYTRGRRQLNTLLANPYCGFQVMQINASSRRQLHRRVSVFRRWSPVAKRGLCEAARFFRKFFQSFSYFAPTLKPVVQPLANLTGLLGFRGVVTTLLLSFFFLSEMSGANSRGPQVHPAPSPTLAFFHLGFLWRFLVGVYHAGALISQSHHAVCYCKAVWLSRLSNCRKLLSRISGQLVYKEWSGHAFTSKRGSSGSSPGVWIPPTM